jgi:four helix bundle protein
LRMAYSRWRIVKMFRFENLEVWKESLIYAKNVYRICREFPKEELFGLTSQIKRAVLSISSNIAEGSGSSSKKDFAHYLDIAIKSIFETVSQLFFAKELEFINQQSFNNLYSEAEILVKKIQNLRLSLKDYPPSAISHTQ